MEFFIPHLLEGSTAEDAWAEYLRMENLGPATRRVRSLTYEKEGARYVATVGQPRQKYAQRRGTQRDPDYERHGSNTGTDVTAIADPGGPMLFVWSMSPYGGWANPSYVGRTSITEIEYFSGAGEAN
jgi:hypothetical protein